METLPYHEELRYLQRKSGVFGSNNTPSWLSAVLNRAMWPTPLHFKQKERIHTYWNYIIFVSNFSQFWSFNVNGRQLISFDSSRWKAAFVFYWSNVLEPNSQFKSIFICLSIHKSQCQGCLLTASDSFISFQNAGFVFVLKKKNCQIIVTLSNWFWRFHIAFDKLVVLNSSI